MYILSGKGSVAGVDLAAYVLKTCQRRGVMWDDDLPEYTLDFLTKTPSVSKSLREGTASEVVTIFNQKLEWAKAQHDCYMLLCLTAHKLIPQLDTTLECVNLWEEAFRRIENIDAQIAFLGTQECLPEGRTEFVTLPGHIEQISDLIASVKRGHARLGESYAAHPKHILKKIYDFYQGMGISKFFLACTDLHVCKQYLMEFGVDEDDIIDILEIAGDEVIRRQGRQYTEVFLDKVSEALTYFRYKYISGSDSLETGTKTEHLNVILDKLPVIESDTINILDIGGSSTGHSVALAKKFSPRKCNITLQDISQASLDHAKELYQGLPNISATFECGDIVDFDDGKKYDAILCLGVLLYVAGDDEFVQTVRNISNLTKPGGLVITRDCLTDEANKIYLDFGGVVRSRQKYESSFKEAGFNLVAESSFVIERPVRRVIKTAMWRRSESSV